MGFFCFLKKILWTRPFMEPLIHSFWTSGDGFEARVGSLIRTWRRCTWMGFFFKMWDSKD